MKDQVVRKILLLTLIATLVGSVVVGCGAGKEEILIGAPMPLTGPYASDGEQMKMALELAIEEQNAAGGLLGRTLKLVTGDVGGLEAEKIKAVGERLVGEAFTRSSRDTTTVEWIPTSSGRMTCPTCMATP